MVGIESHKSQRYNSEYEIFVNLECDSENIPDLAKSLQRQLSYVRVDSDDLSKYCQNPPNKDKVQNSAGAEKKSGFEKNVNGKSVCFAEPVTNQESDRIFKI